MIYLHSQIHGTWIPFPIRNPIEFSLECESDSLQYHKFYKYNAV